MEKKGTKTNPHKDKEIVSALKDRKKRFENRKMSEASIKALDEKYIINKNESFKVEAEPEYIYINIDELKQENSSAEIVSNEESVEAKEKKAKKIISFNFVSKAAKGLYNATVGAFEAVDSAGEKVVTSVKGKVISMFSDRYPKPSKETKNEFVISPDVDSESKDEYDFSDMEISTPQYPEEQQFSQESKDSSEEEKYERVNFEQSENESSTDEEYENISYQKSSQKRRSYSKQMEDKIKKQIERARESRAYKFTQEQLENRRKRLESPKMKAVFERYEKELKEDLLNTGKRVWTGGKAIILTPIIGLVKGLWSGKPSKALEGLFDGLLAGLEEGIPDLVEASLSFVNALAVVPLKAGIRYAVAH